MKLKVYYQMEQHLKHMRDNGVKVIGGGGGGAGKEGAIIIPEEGSNAQKAAIVTPGDSGGMMSNPTDSLRSANGGLPS